MTPTQKKTTKDWVLYILIAVSAFLGGSNVTGWMVTKQLVEHKMEPGHPVLETRMDNMEERHERDMQRMEVKLDQIIRELRNGESKR